MEELHVISGKQRHLAEWDEPMQEKKTLAAYQG